jgi:hypothetical protein
MEERIYVKEKSSFFIPDNPSAVSPLRCGGDDIASL